VRIAGHEEAVEDLPDGGVRESPDGGRDSRYRQGPDEDTARRLEFDERKVPESVSGEITVDESTAVIVKAHFQGRFRVPEGNDQSGATLDVAVSYDLHPDASLKVEPPKDVSAPKFPHAVIDPLWFLDGGTARGPAAEEEEGESAEEEAPAPPATPKR